MSSLQVPEEHWERGESESFQQEPVEHDQTFSSDGYIKNMLEKFQQVPEEGGEPGPAVGISSLHEETSQRQNHTVGRLWKHKYFT